MKVSKQYSNKNNIIKENLIFITVKNLELTDNANIKKYKKYLMLDIIRIHLPMYQPY